MVTSRSSKLLEIDWSKKLHSLKKQSRKSQPINLINLSLFVWKITLLRVSVRPCAHVLKRLEIECCPQEQRILGLHVHVGSQPSWSAWVSDSWHPWRRKHTTYRDGRFKVQVLVVSHHSIQDTSCTQHGTILLGIQCLRWKHRQTWLKQGDKTWWWLLWYKAKCHLTSKATKYALDPRTNVFSWMSWFPGKQKIGQHNLSSLSRVATCLILAANLSGSQKLFADGYSHET